MLTRRSFLVGATAPAFLPLFGSRATASTLPVILEPSGINDGPALQSALVAGADVHLAPGQWRFLESIHVPSDVKLTASWAAVLQMYGAWGSSAGLFLLEGVSNVSLEGLRIDGMRTGKSAGGYARGVYAVSSSAVRMRQLHISDCSHAGIFIDYGCSDFGVSDNRIFRGGDAVANGAFANGISVDGTPSSPSRGVVISSNYIEGATDTGIGLHDVSLGCVVSGNIINGTGIGRGIDIAEASEATVSGNTIRGTGGNGGIYLGPNNPNARDVSDVTISGNTIIEEATGNPGAHGIILGWSAFRTYRRITIAGNTIRGWRGCGIAGGLNLTESLISGNTIQGCGGDGVMLDQGSGAMTKNMISNNIIAGNGGYAVRFHPAMAGNMVRGNLLTGNALGDTNLSPTGKTVNSWSD